MPQILPSVSAFHQKIENFCAVRLASRLPAKDFDNLKAYMLGLVMRRALPPLHAGRLNWREIAATCQLSDEGLAIARIEARHGFAAIMRWISGPVKKQKPVVATAPIMIAKPFMLRQGTAPVNGKVAARADGKPAANVNAAQPRTAAAMPLRRAAGTKGY